MKTSTWHNCYDETLKAFITPESFAHPAKMALNLTRRIFEYGESQGYWNPGDLIADCFGGIGTTGLVGAYAGYRVIMCELEPRFVALNQANIDRNAAKLQRLGKPLPVVVQGDSRRFAGVIAQVMGVVTSPPYAENVKHDRTHEQRDERRLGEGFTGRGRGSFRGSENYGQTDGQIGNLSEGDLAGVVTSPPYVSGVHHPDQTGAWGGQAQSVARDLSGYGQQVGQLGQMQEGDLTSVIGVVTSPPFSPPGNQPVIGQGTRAQMSDDGRLPLDDQQGQTVGNIAALKIEDLESVIGVVTSPPWSDTLARDVIDKDARRQWARDHGVSNAEHVSPVDMERVGARDQPYGDYAGQIGTLNGKDLDRVVGVLTSPPCADSVNTSDKGGIDWDKAGRPDRTRPSEDRHGVQGDMPMTYGSTDGQIGALKEDAGKETYWSAMAQVYAQLYQVLRAGGVAAVVVKDYVRNKARVPLCDQTAQLLEAVGFAVIERTRAMLTKETHAGIDMFSGEHITRKTERKSFFRRLSESKVAADKFWETIDRQTMAKVLIESHARQWIRFNEDSLKSGKDPGRKTITKPTRARIISAAKIIAYKAAGSPDMKIETAIDYEEVLWARKSGVISERERELTPSSPARRMRVASTMATALTRQN